MEKYEIKKVVGEGSYGKAILCKRKADSKLCIIKQISIKKLSKKEALLTEQEATLLKRLQHPNIVTFWESFLGNNNLHIVMEYADGGDLDHYIKAHAKSVPRREIPEKQVVNMFVQLSLAIKHIHDRKILHRDLKSQNVFLTSSGQLKLGDFGVSRVLRHTVELAATQIGTPYYMSPEIMNNQRYNSKTDIWSLGCILYELMCLRLPFDGSSMKQLCHNIIKVNPVSPSLVYSTELRELVRDTLHKNPKTRPGINSILSRPIMRSKISALLGETKRQAEFCHTVLHGANVLSSNAHIAQPAPPSAPMPQLSAPQAQAYRQVVPPPPVVSAPQRPSSANANANANPNVGVNAGAYAAYAAAGRPSGAGPSVAAYPAAGPLRGPPVVQSSAAAQAVAMLQAQRQQQLMRQQQQQAQQQQYVGAMAAQMKAQIELTRQAELARARAQLKQQQEDEQRRARHQAEAKMREQQQQLVRAAEAQKQYEKQRVADEQMDKVRRAAELLEQQKALERKRQERMAEEARKIREEERVRMRAQAAQAAQAQARAAARSPATVLEAAGGGGGPKAGGAAAVHAPAVARRPSMKPPIPANVPSNQQPSPAPVRQFSAAALLAKRRHSAPEKPPSAYAAPQSAQASAAPPVPGPVPTRAPVVTTAAALRAKATANASPTPSVVNASAAGGAVVAAGAAVVAANPFKAVVDSRSSDKNKDKAIPPPWLKRNAPSPTPGASATAGAGQVPPPAELVVVGARASPQQPSPSASPRPSQQPSPVPSNNKESSRPPPYVRDVSHSSAAAAGIASPKPAPFSPTPSSPSPAGFSPYERRVAVDSALSKVQDVMQAVQGLNLKGRRVDVDHSSSGDSTSYGSILPPTPSTAVATPTPAVQKSSGISTMSNNEAHQGEKVSSSGASSPWLSDLMGQMGQLKNQMQNLQQLRSPSVAASSHSLDVDDDYCVDNEEEEEEEEDLSYASSMSSITTANTPVPYGNNSNRGPVSVPKQAQPQLQSHHSHHHHVVANNNSKVASQRTSYPLTAESSIKRNKMAQPEGFPTNDGMQPSSSKDSLNSRKESRARQQQDFRAFVQAQKKIHHSDPAEDNTQDSACHTAAAAGGTAETQAAGARPNRVPAFTPQSQRAGDPDNVSEHGSLASVSSYSVPASSSQDSSQNSPEYPQKPVPSGASALHIKVPHLHVHAHNHKIKPTTEAPSAVRKNSAAKGSAVSNKKAGPSSAHSQASHRKGVPSVSSVNGAGSVASSVRSSPGSAPNSQSPRNTPAAGFNVEEFRSQREAERREMRQLMQDRRNQLQAQRGADGSNISLPATPASRIPVENGDTEGMLEDSDIAVLVPAKPPKQHYRFEASPQKEKDVDTSMGASLKYTLDGTAVTHRAQADDSYEQSRIFAHLETGTQAALVGDPAFAEQPDNKEEFDEEDEEEEELLLEQSFAQQLLDEQGGADELGLTANNDFEYSVLIEQMQQILRKPTVVPVHKAHSHAHTQHKLALGSIAEEGSAERVGPRDNKLSPGRALAGELMFEGNDDEDGDEGEEVLIAEEGEEDVEVEDPDEFEEEELMILEDLPDGDNDSHCVDQKEGGQDVDEDIDYANEDYRDGDSSDDEATSEVEDGIGCAESDCDDSHEFDGDNGIEDGVVDYSASHDPFLLPLQMMPALQTADMALLDPLRHQLQAHHPLTSAGAAASARDGAGSTDFATPDRSVRNNPSNPHSHLQSHAHAHALAHERTASTAGTNNNNINTDEAARRRLQVAELQEYLVEKLGSAKVSEALHLLSVSTEATMLAPPGTGSPAERLDNYYDERDEELLNRIEDILGVDCLHYLDDMFTLLTLQQ